MSAYIVSDAHIIYLVNAAIHLSIARQSAAFRWHFTGGKHSGETQTLAQGDLERMAEVANMLYHENVRSVAHRYPRERAKLMPNGDVIQPIFTVESIPLQFESIDAIQVIKAVRCYEYQACEHPGFKSSEAHAFCAALVDWAISSLPGYDAAVWGCPKDK